MDSVGFLATVLIPAFAGLLGWAFLRQRGVSPLLSAGAALAIALLVMTAAFILMY